MSTILETRTEICHLDTSYLKEVLRERFYVELTLERNVDDEVRVELNKLQREYDSLKTRF